MNSPGPERKRPRYAGGDLYDWTRSGGVGTECAADAGLPALVVVDRAQIMTVISRCYASDLVSRKGCELTVADARSVANSFTFDGAAPDAVSAAELGKGTYGLVVSVPYARQSHPAARAAPGDLNPGSISDTVAMKISYCADDEDYGLSKSGLDAGQRLKDCRLVEFNAFSFLAPSTNDVYRGALVVTFMPVLLPVSPRDYDDNAKIPLLLGLTSFLREILSCLSKSRAAFTDMKLPNLAMVRGDCGDPSSAFRLIDLDGMTAFPETSAGVRFGSAATYPLFRKWDYRKHTYASARIQTEYACAVTAIAFIDPDRALDLDFRRFSFDSPAENLAVLESAAAGLPDSLAEAKAFIQEIVAEIKDEIRRAKIRQAQNRANTV